MARCFLTKKQDLCVTIQAFYTTKPNKPFQSIQYMKPSILLSLLLCVTALNAQITVNRSHLVTAGQKTVQATSNSSHAKAASGSSMNWNFSDLNADEVDSLRFGLPFWYEGYQNFPQANLAQKSFDETDSSVVYLKADNSELRLIGVYDYSYEGQGPFILNTRIMAFPCTYNSNFNETNTSVLTTFELGLDPDSTGPIPFIDSIRVNLIRTVKSNVDGWGNMQTPLGTYPALKQTNLEISSQSFAMKTGGNWINIPSFLLSQLGFPSIPPDSNYSVNFWTNDASVAFPLVSYNYGPSEDSVSNVNWLMTKPQASGINTLKQAGIAVYPNPVADLLTVDLKTKIVRLQIINSEGRLLYQKDVSETEQIALGNYQAGIYLLQVTDLASGELIGTQKIIKP